MYWNLGPRGRRRCVNVDTSRAATLGSLVCPETARSEKLGRDGTWKAELRGKRSEGDVLLGAERPLRKRENTRARLIEAATSVFVEKGFAGAKIDDVVRAAGFTRGAFYSNYSSMEDLLGEAVLAHGRRILTRFRETIDSSWDPSVDGLMEVLEAMRADGRTMYILTSELNLYAMRHPKTYSKFEDYHIGLNREVYKLVESVLAKIGREPTTDIDRVSSALVSAFLDGVSYDFMRCTESEDSTVLHSLIEAILYGMSRPIDGSAEPISKE